MDDCKSIIQKFVLKSLGKSPITSRKLLIVLFGGMSFFLFLSFNFEPQQNSPILHLI